MDRYDLTLLQVTAWKDTVEKQIDYYQRLRSRMQFRQFSVSDSLWLETCEVHKALRELALDLHHIATEMRRHGGKW